MYVVALTRWGRPLDQELQELARLLQAQPYDLRMRLTGPLPVVVSRLSEAAEARALLEKLRERGHGVVACDGEKLLASEQMITPRSFELDEEGVALDDPARPPERVLYSTVLALIHAQLEIETRTTATSQKRKFSAGRAIITGGLVVTKKVTRESRDQQNEYEQVLYLFRKSSTHPIILRQNALRYDGLGRELGHSSVENFSRLIGTLRERAPGALYDDRLLTRRRRAVPQAVTKSKSLTKSNVSIEAAASSNASETDLAAYLVALAHHGGQL